MIISSNICQLASQAVGPFFSFDALHAALCLLPLLVSLSVSHISSKNVSFLFKKMVDRFLIFLLLLLSHAEYGEIDASAVHTKLQNLWSLNFFPLLPFVNFRQESRFQLLFCCKMYSSWVQSARTFH